MRIGILHPCEVTCIGLQVMFEAAANNTFTDFASTTARNVSMSNIDVLIIGDEIDGVPAENFLRTVNLTNLHTVILCTSHDRLSQIRIQSLNQSRVRQIVHLPSLDNKKISGLLNRVFDNNMHLDPYFDSRVVDLKLGLREEQVLKLLCQGKSAKEIASALSMSEHTVFSHKISLANKFGTHSTVELVIMALENGIISFPSAPGAGSSAAD